MVAIETVLLLKGLDVSFCGLLQQLLDNPNEEVSWDNDTVMVVLGYYSDSVEVYMDIYQRHSNPKVKWDYVDRMGVDLTVAHLLDLVNSMGDHKE